ncbi:MAG TPA: hypothetical protein DDZ80_06345 [Cyanobacteria bacterium UBA8803]|nr:hypothetical protein [Cyanobacteria bacterium UBA9273]HBL58152.1 hypothetical protein [Cyanobacteria bacterium UBA8803]
MSAAININKFSQFFILYAFVSLVVYFVTGFTILAGLVYLFILSPFYLLCIAHVVSLAQKHSPSLIRYRKFLIYLIALFQILVICFSPSNCYGVKQGVACSSFIQSLLGNYILNNFENGSSLGGTSEFIFPVALVFYGISVVAFLGMLRIEPIG